MHVMYTEVNEMDTHTYTHVQWCVCVFSDSAFSDWFHHKTVLSSHLLKLWSHRYVCSNCSAWHWIIHLLLFLFHLARAPHFILYSFFSCRPHFLFCYFPFLSQSYSCISFSLFLPLVLTLSSVAVFPPLHCSSSSHSTSISHPPSPPPPSIPSLHLSSLYLSPVLSALRRVSAITPLHLLIPVLIQPSTHSCLTSLFAALTNMRTHTHVHTPAGCTNVPADVRSPVCPHTHTRLLCRKMPFVKGQGASISGMRQPALWCSLEFCFPLASL